MSTSLKFAQNESSSRNNVVIQCPQCETRFAVDPGAIQAVESPRFHCSKCDYIFALQETSQKKVKPDIEIIAEPVEPATKSAEAEVAEGIVAVYRNTPKVQPITRTADTTKQLEIPKRWDASVKSSAPRESVVEQIQMPLGFSNEKSESISSSSRNERITDTIEIAAFGSVKNTPLVEENVPSQQTATNAAPSTKAPVNQRTLAPLSEMRRPTVWSHIAMPIAACFLLIVGLSAALRFSEPFSTKFVKSAVPSALEAAPGDLYIRNSNFQRVTLDSGETIRVISGTIVNNAGAAFKDIQLEGALFDGAGKTIGAVRADAAATLAKTKIKSLTPEMIRDLQTGAQTKRVALRPGEDRDFAIALVGSEYSGARHFGARIYSAKALSN